MPSSTDQVPLVTSDWLVAPLYCMSLFLPLLHSSLILALLCLFIWASDMRLEFLVFTVVYFDRWKSCIRCTCNMLGHKLLLGVLALWGSDQSLGNSEVQERRSQVNVDGSGPPGVFFLLLMECMCLFFLSQVKSVLSAPLLFQVRNGHIKRITDNDIQSLVLEIEGTNVR